MWPPTDILEVPNMNEIFNGVKLVALDMMGVVLEKRSLVKEGLYPLYREQYSYDYIKKLYAEVRNNTDGDISLWKGLKEVNPDTVRSNFLEKFSIDSQFEMFRTKALNNGMRLGILSNMPKEWSEFFQSKMQLGIGYDPVIFSGKVGLRKPDREIYELFITQSFCDPEKIVFIDDKLDNLKTASAVGMKTILFDRARKQEGFLPDMVIEKFEELY